MLDRLYIGTLLALFVWLLPTASRHPVNGWHEFKTLSVYWLMNSWRFHLIGYQHQSESQCKTINHCSNFIVIWRWTFTIDLMHKAQQSATKQSKVQQKKQRKASAAKWAVIPLTLWVNNIDSSLWQLIFHDVTFIVGFFSWIKSHSGIYRPRLLTILS